MSAKPSVREKFSLEFVSGADAEAAALKDLFGAVAGFPDLVLFDPEAKVVEAQAVQAEEAQEVQTEEVQAETFDAPDYSVEDADPVAELRMLFGAASSY